MSVETLYGYLGLPDASLLDKRIYKKMFHEHGQLSSADKKALSADVEHVLWKYTLKASTVQIRPYEDDEREYLEVAVIEVGLNSRKLATRIAEIIQRAIPYPVFLVLAEGKGIAISVAHKRFSLAEKGAIVADGFLTTPWMDPPASETDESFFDSLDVRGLSHVDFLALYQDLTVRVLARNCAELTGKFELQTQSEDERRQALAECREMEREIASLKAAIRKEAQFAEKVELNTNIKALEARLNHAVAAL